MTTNLRRAMCAAVALLAWGVPARATTVTITLPTLTATPGATVNVPLHMDQPLAGLNVTSIQFRLPFDPTRITGATESGAGVVDAWGAPFTNTTSTFYALATAGLTPVTSSSTVLETVQLTVSASATTPSDQPLTLTNVLLNEGAPATVVVSGVLHIRAAGAVGDDAPAGFALRAIHPNPARGPVQVGFSLPASAADGAAARLAVHGLDGRVVRVLAASAAAGAHTASWDTADTHGVPVAPGIYFVRLEWQGRVLTRRLAVMR